MSIKEFPPSLSNRKDILIIWGNEKLELQSPVSTVLTGRRPIGRITILLKFQNSITTYPQWRLKMNLGNSEFRFHYWGSYPCEGPIPTALPRNRKHIGRRMYLTKKLGAEALRRGLEFDNSVPWWEMPSSNAFPPWIWFVYMVLIRGGFWKSESLSCYDNSSITIFLLLTKKKLLWSAAGRRNQVFTKVADEINQAFYIHSQSVLTRVKDLVYQVPASLNICSWGDTWMSSR
jgi:hypothetical protein